MIYDSDEYLKPFKDAIDWRVARTRARAENLASGAKNLADFASAHEYYGLHRTKDGWVFREWAPNATSMWLVGDFSEWKTNPVFEARRIYGTN